MDRALVQRAIAGDHDAFGELARASIGRLYAIAHLIVRRRLARPLRRSAIPIASSGSWVAPPPEPWSHFQGAGGGSRRRRRAHLVE